MKQINHCITSVFAEAAHDVNYVLVKVEFKNTHLNPTLNFELG